MNPIWLTLVCLIASSVWLHAADYDLVVYGGTSAAVIAAVQAKKMGKSVVIVSPDKHLGGLSSSGLGFTDTGTKPSSAGSRGNFIIESGNSTSSQKRGSGRS